ncbi:NACHT domain-containing protein [Streptomyces sp. NPDC002265]|uniref:NACHT domain-containing protein n=1 Tax=Streptomyces sp. NPDC002265 TaxID=3154415 RepID=UPI003316BCD6
MDSETFGFRLASDEIGPLVRRLFVQEEPGAGSEDKPVRVSRLVSFSGQQRTSKPADLRQISATLVKHAMEGVERPLRDDEQEAVTGALTTTLLALGRLKISDAQAVQMGHQQLAQSLRYAAYSPDRHLPARAAHVYENLLDAACLHVLYHFARRSAFIARTETARSRNLAQLIARQDESARSIPRLDAGDSEFEQRYLAYIADKHCRLVIYGIDLYDSPDRWPLDVAYLSLQATWSDGGASGLTGRLQLPNTTHVPAEKAFAHSNRVLLRGVAGSGKTTLVQWLAVQAAHGPRPGRVPFVLPLRTLIRSMDGLPTPEEFLTAVRCPLSAPAGWAERVLTMQRGLLLVDGVDEIPQRDRSRTREWIHELVRAFPGNQWLVTSRLSAVRDNWLAEDGFRDLTLSPMSHANVRTFIRRWHAAAAAPEYEESLLTAVRAKKDLGSLATNPLMCGLMCALHRDRKGFLPLSRKALYDAALTMLLARRDRERDMGLPDGIELDVEPKIQLLQRLAYWLIRNGRNEMDHVTATNVVAQGLPHVPAAQAQGDAGQIFKHLLLRSGLLREPVQEAVDFIHRTFQDYLGARAAVEAWDIGLLVSNAADSQWEDVIRMAVAHARPKERAELLDELIKQGDRAEGHAARARIHLLAMAALEHATEIAPEVRTRVESRASALISPASLDEAHALAEAGSLALELLPPSDGLTDEEARNVVAAAALIGTDAALPVLSRFRGSRDAAVCEQLVQAWAEFDPHRYAEEVIAHVQEDVVFTVTSEPQIRALGELGPRERVQISCRCHPELLTDVLDPSCLTWLSLRDNPALRSLDFLQPYRRLTTLSLEDCPSVTDLTPLEVVGLDRLYLCDLPGLYDASGLNHLNTLRHLTVASRLPGSELTESLPTDAGLLALSLQGDATRRTGLLGISAWPTLTALSLSIGPGDITREGWDEVARLPELSELTLHESTLCAVDEARALPSVRSLRLVGEPSKEDRDLIKQVLFPNLDAITLTVPQGGMTNIKFYEARFPSVKVQVAHGDTAALIV